MDFNILHKSSAQFDETRHKINVALFPIGACEIYGPHLPLGSDGLVAEYVAERVAEKSNGIVLPLIPVGCSKVLDDFPGTLSVSHTTLYNYAKDVIESIIKWDIKKIFIVQGHLTNVAVIDQLVFDLKEVYVDIKFAQIDVWRYIKNNSFDVSEDEMSSKMGHACEVGTSVLKYVRGDLVLNRIPETTGLKIQDKFPDINSYFKFKDVSDSGVLGSPEKASSEKGKILIDRIVNRITDYIDNWN
jgi:creatinine amidohydrolase